MMMPGEATSKPATVGVAPNERRVGDRRSSGRSSQTVLRQIVDRLADGIVVVSVDGYIRFVNPAAEALFGRTMDELVGEEFGYPLSATDATEIEIVRRGSGIVVAELRMVEADWEFEKATLVSLRDVTDRKVAEEHGRQLERERAARAEAEAANHAKSEFLAVMSHELRTPLNAVLGYAELLDLGVVGALTPEQRQQIGRILASGRHLLGLVNEILDLAKVEAGRLTVQRVPATVAEVVEASEVLSQPQAEARGIVLRSPGDIARSLQFIGDRDRVVQILANLLSNAVKFTAPGGTIRIEVVSEQHDDVPANLDVSESWIAIRVIDTGIGVAPDQLDEIFAPFVQAEGGHTRAKDGTGLGLTISRRLARLMGGDVTVRSVLGEGSSFTLWLPAAGSTGQQNTAELPASRSSVVESRTHGLAECGEVLTREIESIVEAFVAQLRCEPLMPAAATLRSSQIADHVPAMLADIASALVTLDESNGTPSALLHDTADIQRFIADRHGVQRARLGWTTEALARESAVLEEVVEHTIRRCVEQPRYAPQLAEALGVIKRYLEQAAESSRRALDRTVQHAELRGTAPEPS